MIPDFALLAWSQSFVMAAGTLPCLTTSFFFALTVPALAKTQKS
jgi:hypothetical protein